MLAYFFLKGLGACMALVINATQARTVEYTMVLQAKWLALDGFYRETYTVNGQTPGPPLVVNEGDIVRVHVVNKLNELMSMHWHGVDQRRAPWMDGVQGISQWGILPGDNFTYEFDVIDQYGVYWYHAHSRSTYEEGLRGPLIIQPRPSRTTPWDRLSSDPIEQDAMNQAYLRALPIMVHDWRHTSIQEKTISMIDTAQDPYCVDSLLINGQGRVHCLSEETLAGVSLLQQTFGPVDVTGCIGSLFVFADKVGARNPVTCTNTTSSYTAYRSSSYASDDGKWMAFHVINGGAAFETGFAIDGHDLWVIAADGNFVAPQKVTALRVQVGNRYSVLARLGAPGSYTIRSAFIQNLPQIQAGYAVLQIDNDPIQARQVSAPSEATPTFLTTFTQPVALQTSSPERILAACTDSEDCGYHVVPGQEPRFGSHSKPQAQFSNGWKVTQSYYPVDELPPQADLKNVRLTYNGSLTGAANATFQNDTALVPLVRNPPPQGDADYTLFMAINLTSGTTWALDGKVLNGVVYDRTPQLFMTSVPASNAILSLRNGSVVDIIFEEARPPWVPNPPHPIHKHQSKVWLLGTSPASNSTTPISFPFKTTSEARDKQPGLLNFDNAPLRDGWTVPSLGWTVIRYQVTFPSATLMHCHIGTHFSLGMAVVLREALDLFDPTLIPTEIRDAPHVSDPGHAS